MAFIGRMRELAGIVGLDDPRVQRIMENAERFPKSMDAGERILRKLAREKGISLADPPVYTAPEELPQEGRLLGNVQQGDRSVAEYRYPITELSGHLGIFGLTGTGKSMLTGHLCEGWIESSIITLIFAPSNEYLSLLDRFSSELLAVIRARDFPLNPFQNPEGSCYSDLEWLSGTVSVLRQTTYMRDGSCNLLLKIVGDMYRERGVFDGSKDYPSLKEVFDALITKKFSTQSRHAGFLETAVNRIQWTLQSFPNLNARKSLVPAQVLKRSLIIRMDDLSPEESEVFVNLFLHWLNSKRMKALRSATDLVLVLEEAHQFLSQRRMSRYDLGEPLILQQLRTARKFGTGIVVVDQVPSELPSAVLGNLGTRIILRLTN